MREHKVLLGFISLCVLVVGCVFLYDYTNVFDIFIKDNQGVENFVEYVEPENLQYTDEKYFAFNKKTKEILDYDIKGGLDVVIPKKINGVKVLRIGDISFMNKGIESVIIPEGVKEIGFQAFFDNNLKEIHIPKSVKEIGFKAFESNKIKKIDLSNNKLYLDGSVFNNNNIQEVIYNEKIELNEWYTFNFEGNELTVENIKNYPSDKIDMFESIFLFEYNDEIIETEEYIFNKTRREIMAYLGNETDIVIPSTIDSIYVEVIGHYSFDEKNIEKITLPNTIKSIGASAFSKNNIEDLVLPNNIKYIWGSAFSNNNINRLVIPKTVKIISGDVFLQNNIEELVIEDVEGNIFSWSTGAFLNNNLINDNIHIANEDVFKENWKLIFGYEYSDDVVISNDFIFNKSKNLIIKYIGEDKKNLIVPSYIEGVEVKIIGVSAFVGKKFENVIIEENIRVIAKNAFNSCGIVTLELPNSIFTVYEGSFENNKLEYLELQNNEANYRGHVFKNNELKSIKIPSSIKFVEYEIESILEGFMLGTFFGNTNIKEVIIDGDDKDIFDEDWDNMFQVGVDIDVVKQ